MLDWVFGKRKPGETQACAQKQDAGQARIPESLDGSTTRSSDGSSLLASEIRSRGPESVRPESDEEKRIAVDFGRYMNECETIMENPKFDLPMLPATAVRIMQLLQDPDVPAKKIGDTVLTDPVLTAKFLRTANSPYYGGTVRIDSVHQAVSRMGLTMVKNIVLTISLNTTILREPRLSHIAQQLWQHSIYSAITAQELAITAKAPAASAFMSALMHDIGKIPAFLILRKCIRKNLEPRPLLMASLIEEHHIRAGIALLRFWELPAEACLAISSHHTINSEQDAESRIKLHFRNAEAHELSNLTRMLSTVILADRALTATGYADEPGDASFVDSQLAKFLQLSTDQSCQFLINLPYILKKSSED
jgi:putative nucleotidyltransferase with HDIG domain